MADGSPSEAYFIPVLQYTLPSVISRSASLDPSWLLSRFSRLLLVWMALPPATNESATKENKQTITMDTKAPVLGLLFFFQISPAAI